MTEAELFDLAVAGHFAFLAVWLVATAVGIGCVWFGLSTK